MAAQNDDDRRNPTRRHGGDYKRGRFVDSNHTFKRQKQQIVKAMVSRRDQDVETDLDEVLMAIDVRCYQTRTKSDEWIVDSGQRNMTHQQ